MKWLRDAFCAGSCAAAGSAAGQTVCEGTRGILGQQCLNFVHCHILT